MNGPKSQHSTNDRVIFGQRTLHAHGMELAATLSGGHVLSWIADGRERLFRGPEALMSPGAAIRGGVPVIFPQFATWGTGGRHGFARLLPWRHLSNTSPDRQAFALEDSMETREKWPHRFQLILEAALSPDRLELSFDVANTGPGAFDFTAALHTYLAIDDIGQARISGLTGKTYHDATTGGLCVDPEGVLALDGKETDRIYQDVDTTVRLREGQHGIDIDMTGFRDLVLWNPGPEKAGQLTDLAAGDDRRFICIESARIMRPVSLAPGQSWQGSQTLTLARHP